MADNRKIKKKLIIEGLLAFLIAMTPLLFYSYKYVPLTADTEWSFLGITFTENGYKDVSTAFYYYVGKLIPLILLIVWFITCKRWWYHAILIPIAMYAFQFYSVFSEDVEKIDENEIQYLLIVCMVIIPIIYIIRIKLVDRYVHGIDIEAMEAELKSLRKKQENNNSEKELHKDGPINLNGLPFTEKLNYLFSTGNLENQFRHFQHTLQNWFHLKF
ncbi:hypothetical protein [Maribacter halichondriae]|uniref:hypothetical protein n=1 Tax=Maribacter halichondriae TaxID=2980554 RepID=UPI00235A3ED0|nr:hypothetical protein [Maribacter sp. Hal144]